MRWKRFDAIGIATLLGVLSRFTKPGASVVLHAIWNIKMRLLRHGLKE
jgi:hypothetical protein